MEFGYMNGFKFRVSPGEEGMESPNGRVRRNISRISSIFDYMKDKDKGKNGKNKVMDYLNINGGIRMVGEGKKFGEFKTWLVETLNNYQKREVDSWGDNSRAKELSDHIFNSNHPDIERIDEDRIKIPHISGKISLHTHPLVQKYIEDNGHKLNADDHTYSYKKVPNKDSWQLVKTGKLLNYRKDLQDLHRDTLNSAARNYDNHDIIISRHPYDVAGMSTDKHWTSCMRMADSNRDKGGCNKDYLESDIKHGTHAAFLVKKGTTKPNTELRKEDVVARIALKPFVNNDRHTILVPDGEYPQRDDETSFSRSVSHFMNKHGGYRDNDMYHLHRELYNDGKDQHITINEDTLDHNSDYDVLIHALTHSKNPDFLDRMSNHKNSYMRSYIANNKYTDYKTLDKLRGDINRFVRGHVANHPNTKPETLAKLVDDEDESVRLQVAKNKNTHPDTLHKLSNDKNKDIRDKAIKNLRNKGIK